MYWLFLINRYYHLISISVIIKNSPNFKKYVSERNSFTRFAVFLYYYTTISFLFYYSNIIHVVLRTLYNNFLKLYLTKELKNARKLKIN